MFIKRNAALSEEDAISSNLLNLMWGIRHSGSHKGHRRPAEGVWPQIVDHFAAG